jgi:heat shock protein HslJ
MATWRKARRALSDMKGVLLATSVAMILASACTGTAGQESSPRSTSSRPSTIVSDPTFHASDSPETQIELAGTSWELTIVDGGNWPVGNDPTVKLSFAETHVSWSVGCNLYNAKWKMVDGHIELGRDDRIFSTLVRCDPDVQRIEERLVHILSRSPEVGNYGSAELRLTSSDGVLVFDRSD